MRVIKPSVLTAIVAGALFVPQAVAITGGQVDTKNTYSNVGAVVYAPPDAAPSPRFTGTLIHPRVLLTAGHTTSQFVQNHPWPFTDCYVSFGPDVTDPGTTISRKIEAVITHPGFTWGGARRDCNDVGVIILKEPVNNLPVQELPEVGFLDDLRAAGVLREPGQGGAPFTVVGYGATLDWPPPEETPGDGPRRFAQSDYLALLRNWLHLQQNLATGNGGTGYGDSGGPVFWTAPDGTRALVGITSWGDPNCVAMNFYWRVDIRETLDFIRDVIASLPPESE